MGFCAADNNHCIILVCVSGWLKESGSQQCAICTVADGWPYSVVLFSGSMDERNELFRGVQLFGEKGGI